MLKNRNRAPFPHRLRSFFAAMAMITVVLALALLATATRGAVEAQTSTRNADAKAAPLAHAVEKIDSICAAFLTHAK
jgi:hypothetical protein